MKYLFLLMVAHVAVILPVSFSSYDAPQPTLDSGDVRLLDGTHVLQIYNHSANTWIQACASGFNKGAASAACRQLGFIDAKSFNPHNASQFSMAYTSIKCPTVSNYSLYGELHIFRCALGELINTHCAPVAIECSQGKLTDQSYNGQLSLDIDHYDKKLQSSSDGPVEIFLHDLRGYRICFYDDEFNNKNNNTGLSICRQLGYTGAKPYHFITKSPENAISFNNFSCINNSYACFSHCIEEVSLRSCGRLLHIDCSFDLNEVFWQTSGSRMLCEIPPVNVLSSYKMATYSLGGIILAEVIVAMVIGIIIFLTYCMCCRKGKPCEMVCRCRFRPNSDEPLIRNDENFKLLVAIT
jgi:hypothetical protein